ncbi:hypothetical protein [Marinobacter sp. X15-166B]|uniref:hypothetical protein n=1 Tax=Marinobacter sp. X15-166B TaxID=1897620 RepID=UPI00085C0C88|nr:hypothetical protein [Marinobacter sp. X15-166B]OEY67109.1 hypothetical protein BG841_12030 [Marinobacter sp. X15-166B]
MVERNDKPDARQGPQMGPTLNPGRPADKPAGASAGEEPVTIEAQTAAIPDDLADREDTPDAVASDADMARLRQRKWRLMMRQCDRVVLLDFQLLAMPEWPDNYALALARKKRDFWLLGACLSAAVFLSGLTGSVPAWLAGGGFGAFAVIVLLGVPLVRTLYTDRPSYLDLLARRRQLLRDARKHIAHLEGEVGLAWQCARMSEFNPALKSPRFRELVELSARHALSGALTRREHVRLYLVFMLEAEKAYDRLQQAFFDANQAAIDQGWSEVVTKTSGNS